MAWARRDDSPKFARPRTPAGGRSQAVNLRVAPVFSALRRGDPFLLEGYKKLIRRERWMASDTDRDVAVKRAPRPRRGSSQSDRVVAYSVRDGKQVTASLANGRDVTGFIFGADDFHWSIITEDGQTVLVHKSCPSLLVSQFATIATAPGSVQALVASFRAAVMRDHFHHA